EIDRLVQLTEPELEEFKAARKPVYAHWLSVLKFAYCNQRSNEEMAIHLLKRGQPDLTGIFLIANDPISHTFWHFYQPQEYGGKVEPAMARRLGQTVPNIYRHNDGYLARLRQVIGPETVVMVVSDHGFQASGIVPKPADLNGRAGWLESWYQRRKNVGIDPDNVAVGQSGKHHLDGVFIASGGPVRKGVELSEPPRIYDIAPTILALLGLPVPEDMEGRVLEEIIEPAFLEKHPIRRIASYEEFIDREVLASTASGDDSTIDMLRALGYIE
ncbi:MAG: alkaline phosphatase family protein, partial [Gammaproteobacteria bacterium]